MNTRKSVAGGLGALALLAAAACTGSGEDSNAKGKSGGILRIGTTDDVNSLNPFLALSLQTGVAISMTYPQLVQYDYTTAKGYEIVPDLAESWKTSPDGREITFTLHDGAQWSDKKPMTAQDAAWTINTIVTFAEGPTGQMAPTVEGVEEATAPDPTTLVVRYDEPHGNALDLIASGLPVLPQHIWEKQAAGDGRGLRTFAPEGQSGGMVSGGPFLLKDYKRRGTTVYTPNPSFYGPKSNADAVALTFYTNADSMLEDLTSGKLEMVESVPTGGVRAISDRKGINVVTSDSGLQADLFVNANPRKPTHRELLDPRVRRALALCVDRQQIIDVIFNGYATTVETLVGTLGGEFQNTDLGPTERDCAEANRILDGLGYRRNSDGVRVVPATGSEPEHKMDYDAVTVGQGEAYNVDRTVEILRTGFEEIGVRLTQKTIGDETATWTHLTGADCDPATSTGYTSWDLNVSYSVAEIDPVNTLSGELKASWCAWNFTGSDNAEYDSLYRQATVEIDPDKRRQILWQMQKIYHDSGATISLAEEQEINAYSTKWTGFTPAEVRGFSKLYYTAPHRVG